MRNEKRYYKKYYGKGYHVDLTIPGSQYSIELESGERSHIVDKFTYIDMHINYRGPTDPVFAHKDPEEGELVEVVYIKRKGINVIIGIAFGKHVWGAGVPDEYLEVKNDDDVEDGDWEYR